MRRLFIIFVIVSLCWAGSWIYAEQMPEEVVGAGTDDGGEEWVWNICAITDDWVCMSYPHDCEWDLFRFTTVPIPQGATIDGCTLIVDILSTVYDSPDVEIYCEDTASATTLVGAGEVGDECISPRAKTTAFVVWEEDNIGAGEQPTPELKAVLQELIDRDDWSENNDLAFIFVVPSGDASFYVDSYEEGHPVKLHVWYTAAASKYLPLKK